MCDDLFVTKLELFSRLANDYAASFSPSLSGRVDSGFLLYGQICKFLRRLAARIVPPASLPDDTDWHQIIITDFSVAPNLKVGEFFDGLRIRNKLNRACKVQAEQEVREKKLPSTEVENVARRLKLTFSNLARSYILFLCTSIQGQISGVTDLVKGLSCFDPQVLLVSPLEMATASFTALFQNFCLRKWFEKSQELACHDEYLSFLQQLRSSYPDHSRTAGTITNSVKFLSELPSLSSRPLLYRLFRLSCLCLTSESPELPEVKFGPINTAYTRSRLTDVIQPVQSYVANVPDAIKEAVTSDAYTKFTHLSSTLGSGVLSKTYSPWASVDYFGKDALKEQMQAAHKARSKDAESVTSSLGSPKKISVGKGTHQRSFRDRVGSSTFEKGVEELQGQGTSSSK